MTRPGEIWWADLPAPRGSKPGFRRPFLVIQADAFLASRLRTVLAVALTSNRRLAEAPGNVLLPARVTGLPRDSVANVTQIVTLGEDRLTDHAGEAPSRFMAQVEKGLRVVLDL